MHRLWTVSELFCSLFSFRLDRPARNDSFLSESEAIRNTLAVNKESCRSQNKVETGCAGTELQNSRGQTESSGKCQKSEHSSRTEALKLLNQGQPSKSADVWDNQGFNSSGETQVEDTGRCQEGKEDSDCTGRSPEESKSSGQSQARTGNSETREKPKTSNSETSNNPSVQGEDLTDTPGVSYIHYQTVCWTISFNLVPIHCPQWAMHLGYVYW